MVRMSDYKKLALMKTVVCRTGRRTDIRYVNVRHHPIHIHDGCEILYLIKGRLNVKISYETYRLEEGDFLLINPYETHALEDAGSENGNIAAIIQCGEELYGKKDGILMWQATLYNKDSHLHQQVKTMIREILAADMKTGDGSGRQTDEKLRDLLDFLKNNYNIENYDIVREEKNEFAENQMLSRRINSIIVYLCHHYDESPTLQAIADAHGVSRYYLSHMIRRAFGFSLQELLGIMRAERAELYLLATDWPAGVISDKVGFSSYQYFNKYFKMCFHMSPVKYRKAKAADTPGKTGFDEEAVSVEKAFGTMEGGGSETVTITLSLSEGGCVVQMGDRRLRLSGGDSLCLEERDVKEGIYIKK